MSVLAGLDVQQLYRLRPTVTIKPQTTSWVLIIFTTAVKLMHQQMH